MNEKDPCRATVSEATAVSAAYFAQSGRPSPFYGLSRGPQSETASTLRVFRNSFGRPREISKVRATFARCRRLAGLPSSILLCGRVEGHDPQKRASLGWSGGRLICATIGRAIPAAFIELRRRKTSAEQLARGKAATLCHSLVHSSSRMPAARVEAPCRETFESSARRYNGRTNSLFPGRQPCRQLFSNPGRLLRVVSARRSSETTLSPFSAQ